MCHGNNARLNANKEQSGNDSPCQWHANNGCLSRFLVHSESSWNEPLDEVVPISWKLPRLRWRLPDDVVFLLDWNGGMFKSSCLATVVLCYCFAFHRLFPTTCVRVCRRSAGRYVATGGGRREQMITSFANKDVMRDLNSFASDDTEMTKLQLSSAASVPSWHGLL